MPSEVRFAVVRRALEQHGYTLARVSGSHHVFAKAGSPIVVIPVHGNRVKPRYVAALEKQLGVRVC